MNSEADFIDLRQFGEHLAASRLNSGLSQGRLASRCGLAQQQISYFESGVRFPSLEQALRICRALDVPMQRLLTGTDRAGVDLGSLAIELRGLGVVDLWVRDATVPGAFRRPEEVICLALSGDAPDPRIVEAIPAVLAWADLDPCVLAAHAINSGTTYRLAWLADIALAIDRRSGFPGGCRRKPLEGFLQGVELPDRSAPWDDLGRPGAGPPDWPLARRWRVAYDAAPSQFLDRAAGLHSSRMIAGAHRNPSLITAGPRKEAGPIADDPPPSPREPGPKTSASRRAASALRKKRRPKRSAAGRIASIRRRRRPDAK